MFIGFACVEERHCGLRLSQRMIDTVRRVGFGTVHGRGEHVRILSMVLSGLRGRKRDTAVLGGILLLAFLFLTLSSILLASFSETARQQRQALHGKWQMMYYGTDDKTAARCAEVSDLAQIRLVGKTKDAELVGTVNEQVMALGSLNLEEGRLPENENEILLVRGRMAKEPTVGEEVDLVYLYDYMRGGRMEWGSEIQDAVLRSIRGTMHDPNGNEIRWEDLQEQFHDDVIKYYDPVNRRIDFPRNNTGAYGGTRVQLPPDMELEDAMTSMEDELLYAWAINCFGGSDYPSAPPFRMSFVNAYPGGLYSYESFLINVKNRSNQVSFLGWAFADDIRGTSMALTQTSQALLYKTYTVVGYLSPYADHWDVRGYAMPDAFVAPEAAEAQLSALRRAEQDYYEGAPSFEPSSILLMTPAQNAKAPLAEQILPIYCELQPPYFRVEGLMADSMELQQGFLIGLDPDTGEEKALQMQVYGSSYYLQADDGTWRALSGDPTVASRWAEFEKLLQPIQPEDLTMTDLEEGSRYALRLNQYAYPPSNSAESTIQVLCSGVLIGVAATSTFQVFWVQLRRRRMRLSTLMSIGATDGQILRMLLLEIALLLTAACLLGAGLGFALSRFITGAMKTAYSVPWTALLTGIGLCLSAVLISALIPMLLVLHVSLTGREQLSRRILRLRRPDRIKRQSYLGILLRQMRADRGRSALQLALAAMLALICLMTVYLCHSAYGNYRKSITESGMPDYELVAPYGMSGLYLDGFLENAAPFTEGAYLSVSREAPNVWLHCDEYVDSSPILRTLQSLPEAASMFRQLPGGERGFSVRVLGFSQEDVRLQKILSSLPETAFDKDAFASGDACILLVPRYIPDGQLVGRLDVDEATLEELREDEKAGRLLDLHFERAYRDAGMEDRAIRAGGVITLTAFSQTISGEQMLERSVERSIRVEAVISTLAEPIWPLSAECPSHVLIASDSLVRQLYPSANTRMTAAQARNHRIMAEIFYPDCYGLTRFVAVNKEDCDPIAQDTAVSDLADAYGLDIVNHRMQKEREQINAQRRWMLFLLLGIEMALVLSTLSYSAAGMAVEQDRYRYGTLQSFGVTDGQMLWGEALRSLGVALASLLAAHLVLLLVQLASAVLSGSFRAALMLAFENYPWTAHGLVCGAYILAYVFLQTMPILRVTKQRPIQNMRS